MEHHGVNSLISPVKKIIGTPDVLVKVPKDPKEPVPKERKLKTQKAKGKGELARSKKKWTPKSLRFPSRGTLKRVAPDQIVARNSRKRRRDETENTEDGSDDSCGEFRDDAYNDEEEDHITEVEESPPELDAKLRLLVSFDFGTTYSGIAWALSTARHLNEVHVIKNWKGAWQPGVLEKVKTAIAFPDEDGGRRAIRWGYDIPNGMESTVWFKLLFGANGNLKMVVDDSLLKEAVGQEMVQLPHGISVEEAMTTMYRLLNEHAKSTIKSNSGVIDADNMPTTNIITIPAEYGEAKKAQIKRIVRQAGIANGNGDSLVLVPEPEAAAAVAVHESLPLFSKGTSFTLADIGGGTCDVVSYNLAKIDPLTADSIHPSECGYCGATSVTRAFVKWCHETFGPAFEAISLSERGASSKFIEEFERKLKSFRGDEDEENKFDVPLPTLAKQLKAHKIQTSEYDFGERTVIISMAEMKQFFDTFRQGNVKLVKDQIERVRNSGKEIKVLVLCGGFAQCEYVVSLFRDFCREEMGGRVRLIVPNRPWACVIEGGILRGLLPHIMQEKLSGINLAIETHRQYDESRDTPDREYMCPLRGRRATGYLKWLFKRSDTLNKKTTLKQYVTIWPGERHIALQVVLWRCEDDVVSNDARVDHPRMEVFAHVEVRHELSKSTVTKHSKVPGPKEITVNFDLYPVDEEGMFKIKARIHNREVGELEYEFLPQETR